jgi:hypothetical protein
MDPHNFTSHSKIFVMKKFILGLLIVGFASQLYAQVTTLPEVELKIVNYKYLNAVDADDIDINVKNLEKEVAHFDYVNSEFYTDDWVSFYIPKGKILASYDEEGKIVTTTEKFENIKLPLQVRKAVFDRFPGWIMGKNIYRVTYNQKESKKIYKIILQNGDKIVRIKTDDHGNFIGESLLQ